MAALATGARLGPYEILGPLRSGGMGEVYRARDTRLGRPVALKLLKADLHRDAVSRQRFEREARAIAALTHPHICTLHDVGEHEGDRFLVMELLEGQTLGTRIARAKNGLPIDEALAVAAQIADAIAFAHRHHIVHRDIKPSNIMLTPSGVKLLDFGVARLRAPEDEHAHEPHTERLLTAEHAIVGTLAYMAPEQLDGRADARSDIFAFGAVLFEMLTGRRAFEGDTSSTVIAAIVQQEPPDAGALRPDIPAGLARALRRCLAKNPDKRWQSAADLGDELRWLADETARRDKHPTRDAELPSESSRRSLGMAAGAALIAAALAASVTWGLGRPAERPAPAVMRVEVLPAPADPINVGTTTPTLAISRDGTRLAYASGTNGSGGPLVIREIGELRPRQVAGAPQVRDPFFSPDGNWIGYSSGGQGLRRIPAGGGTPVEIISGTMSLRGASWAGDGTIVYATTNPETGLLRVSDAGGTPTVLTKPNKEQGEADHVLPFVLPAGRGVLFTIMDAAADNPRVAVLDLRDQSQRVLLPGAASASYIAPGYLVYAASGTLFAVRFNLDALRVEGDPQTLANGVLMGTATGAYYAVSSTGSLAYVRATATPDPPRTLVWVDRHGVEAPLGAPARAYRSVRLSPGGRRIALGIADEQRDIWTWDLERHTLTRITADDRVDNMPVWTPDGQQLVFRSRRAGGANLFRQAADGTGAAEQLTTGPEYFLPNAITGDGKTLLGGSSIPKPWTLFQLPLDKAATPQPLLPSSPNTLHPAISPDGRHVAYQSLESAQLEVYVRPFPDINAGRVKISTDGGSKPIWSADGRELFFLERSGHLMAASIDTSGKVPVARVPTRVFSTSLYYVGDDPASYDVAPDGKRFLMIKEDPAARAPNTPIVLVLNLLDSLRSGTPPR